MRRGLLRRMLPVLMGGGGAVPYDEQLVTTFGATEVWPLVDIASGTAITAKVAAARNGTLSGWDLQNAASPVAGKLAPQSGAGDYGNLLTANLASAFDGAKGSVIIWCKHTDWTTVSQYCITFVADGNNLIRIYHDSSGRLSWMYKAGGTEENRLKTGVSTTGWMCLGLSWDKTAEEVRAYFNGVQEGATLTSLGTWAGAIQYSCAGAYIPGTPQSWLGHLAYAAVKFGGVWTPAQMLAIYLAANP